MSNRLPTVVIGAGPVGLAAAAHLHTQHLPVIVLEAGTDVAASISAWEHVRLFSPWDYTIDPVAAQILQADDWKRPNPDALPTGRELTERYLRPLADRLGKNLPIRLEHRVTHVARRRLPGVASAESGPGPLAVLADTPSGTVEISAHAVIDASGTWGSPNPVGGDGWPAIGEVEHADRIFYGIPDVLGKDRPHFSGQRVLVLGSGHSAQNVVRDLAQLRQEGGGAEIVWVIRNPDVSRVFGQGSADPLPDRAFLGAQARRLVETGTARLVTGLRVAEVRSSSSGVTLVGGDGTQVGPVDQVVASTGFQPDLSILRELRLDLDAELECPRRLAPLIHPSRHSCATVPQHGVGELAHPEPGLFIVGMKSYGRAPTFLLPTGYEQVRSIVSALAGQAQEAQTSATSSSGQACVSNADRCGPSVAVDGCAAPAFASGCATVECCE